MRYISILFCLLFTFNVSVPALYGQSVDLAELQRKEKERRKKLNLTKLKPGKKSITDVKPEKRYSFIQMQGNPGSEQEPEEGQAKRTPSRGKKEEDAQKTQEYWQNLRNRLDSQIGELEQKIETDQLTINSLTTQYFNMDLPLEKARLKERLDRMNSAMEENRQRLQSLKGELNNLADNARKAGVPPGWLR
jgi:chromosome segregation ATPase